jgi:BlaI family penicillinase repressor
MKELPKISEAEWQVMKVLWDKSPLTANEIVEKLVNDTEWNPRTIKTLLNRLMNKNALGVQQEGRVYFYYPLVSKEACARSERDNLLKRVYNGALQPLLAAFLEEQKLSKDEIEELKQILENKGKSK